MSSGNHFLHRPFLMEARSSRKKEIDSIIAKMITHNQAIAIKVLTFLSKNEGDGYKRIAEALPTILTPSELEQDLVKELSEKALSSQERVDLAIKNVREQVRDIRIARVQEIDTSIQGLENEKARLLRQNMKYGVQNSTPDTNEPRDLLGPQTGLPAESLGNESIFSDLGSIFVGSELTTIDTTGGIRESGKVTHPLLIVNKDTRIPAIPETPLQFGTIAEVIKSGGEISPEVQVQLARAQEILPGAFDFTELTPVQLKSMVTDMEQFISPEAKSENIDAVLDFIEVMYRKGWKTGMDEKDLKRLQRILRAKKKSEEDINYTTQTIMRLFDNILSEGIGIANILERNIGGTIDTLGGFLKEMRKPFESNGFPIEYRAKAPERAENAYKLMCLVRVLDRAQMVYTQRLPEIVSFYRSTTQEILKFYAELEGKMRQNGKKMQDYFHKDEFAEFEKTLAFIRSVDGGMEQFGRISPKQERALRETIFGFQTAVQSRIEAYADFDAMIDETYTRIPGDVGSAFREIMIRLYDRGENARTSHVGAAGALRFPEIDAFVSEITGSRSSTFISMGGEAIEICLKNPNLLSKSTCPSGFREIIQLYLPV